MIFPGAIVRSLAKTAEDFYASLKAHSSTEPFRARMFDFDALNRADRHARDAGARQALCRDRSRSPAARRAGDEHHHRRRALVEQSKLSESEKLQMKTFDLVIKNARVVRPNQTGVDCLDIGIKDGKVARLAPEITRRGRQRSVRRQTAIGLSGLRRCAHACRHLPAARAGCGERKQGRRHGRRHLEPQLHPHRRLLSQSRRALSRSDARSPASSPTGASGSITAITSRRSKAAISARWNISRSSTA